MLGRVHSTESFGTVDGPGVRFVVFLQGCPMRCLFCHNPDTWERAGGTEVSVSELLEGYRRNKGFYKNGGITVTGGEPLLQIEFVTELFQRAKAEGIHTCLDTSGVTFAPEDEARMEQFERLHEVCDLVLLDLKLMDGRRHGELTGCKNEQILAYARFLSERGKPVWIRRVVVPGLTDGEGELAALGRFLAELSNVRALEILPYHTLGVSKYEKLGRPYPLAGIPQMSKEEAARARAVVLHAYREEKKRHAEG